MRIILLKNVANLGDKGEIKEVASGYALNYLIPEKFAKEATLQAIKELEIQKEKDVKAAEQDLFKAEQLAQKLEGQMVEIKAKANDKGTLFAAVSPVKVVNALADKGSVVEKEQVKLEHIKEVGEHEVVINLSHGLEARITLIINPEAD